MTNHPLSQIDDLAHLRDPAHADDDSDPIEPPAPVAVEPAPPARPGPGILLVHPSDGVPVHVPAGPSTVAVPKGARLHFDAGTGGSWSVSRMTPTQPIHTSGETSDGTFMVPARPENGDVWEIKTRLHTWTITWAVAP